MGISQQDVLNQVRTNGPIVSAQIATNLGVDSYLVGAYLSELLETKSLFLTKSSAAGSPLYYVREQEDKIVMLGDKLKEKDKRTFDLLQTEGVLRDSDLEPLTRVSLSNIPDFAVPLNIKFGEETVRFWKWYLLSNDEVIAIIRKSYAPQPKPESQPVPQDKQDTSDSDTEVTPSSQSQLQQELEDISPMSLCFKNIKNTSDVVRAFDDANIRISASVEIKKNTESDLVVHLPTPLGLQKIFVKVLLKKRISETDLSTAFMQATLKQLPCCFMTTGELTKKAQVLQKGDLRNMLFVQLEK